ncbi:MAG: sulfite exporter TauE/SafE family protein [Phycisphaerae bacterium]|nr:sulfite exporter TauE/SafE family protein [Phycisphaerae bacterium]
MQSVLENWIMPADCTCSPVMYMWVAFVALAMTGISKGGFGGVGTLSVPLMMMVVPKGTFALGMWLPLLVYCDILTLRYYPREWQPRSFWVIAPWTFVGIILGCLLLGRMSPPMTKFLVGATSILFVGLDIVRAWLKRRIDQAGDLPAFKPTWLTASPFGLAAGVSTMVAHAAGAITTIYFLPQRMNKRDFVGTQARYYFIFNSLKIPFYAAVPFLGGVTIPLLNQPLAPANSPTLITAETLTKTIWMLPLAPFCVWLGATLNERMSPALFHKVVYALLLISGVYLVLSNWQVLGL